MSFKANLSVKEGLDHLAGRLEPIIAKRLQEELRGHPWTVVLQILDEKKGYSSGYTYATYDLQAQLRILTERLGDLGFPFDDKDRTVSTLGNELRIVRKRMAHMHSFSIEEAFRANDFCVRLLEHFGDDSGYDEADRIRHEALAASAADAGITERAAAAAATPQPVAGAVAGAHTIQDPGEAPKTPSDAEVDVVTPDPQVLVRKSTVIGDKRLGFEPWNVVAVGGTDVLDDLPKKAAKEQVRAVAVEIATFEGPIRLDVLVQRVGQSFGLRQVRKARERKLAYQIRQAGLFVDDDKFVWPKEIDPGTWAEFRPNSSEVERSFVQVSPVEIVNALRWIRRTWPDLTEEEQDAKVLQTFGRRRRTKQISAHLERARGLLVD